MGNSYPLISPVGEVCDPEDPERQGLPLSLECATSRMRIRGQDQPDSRRPAKLEIGPSTRNTPVDHPRCCKLFLRIWGPSLFLGVLVFSSCVSAAIALQRQQGLAVTVLEQVVASRELESILDKALVGLEALKPDQFAVAWEEVGVRI